MKRIAFIVISGVLVVGCIIAVGKSTPAPAPSLSEPAGEVSSTAQFTDSANPIPGANSSCTAAVTTESTTVPAAESTSEPSAVVISTEPSSAVTETVPVQPSTTAQVTESSTEAVTYPAGPQLIGKTANGYDIIQENGLYYVDGILIANKTYPLRADYYPGALLGNCSAAFETMKNAAQAEGLNLYVSSGFRSYYTQDSLYQRYCASDGQAAADRYSARPGHSEHQTGLAIDLNTIEYSFADTPEGQWVAANCHKYGFILRYPEGKEAQTGYRYEPWHIRYVGTEKATAIYNSGLCLEEYYGITSQYQ